jgi:hypothetical protein
MLFFQLILWCLLPTPIATRTFRWGKNKIWGSHMLVQVLSFWTYSSEFFFRFCSLQLRSLRLWLTVHEIWARNFVTHSRFRREYEIVFWCEYEKKILRRQLVAARRKLSNCLLRFFFHPSFMTHEWCCVRHSRVPCFFFCSPSPFCCEITECW